MNFFGDQKPDIKYPCPWTYKLIGTDSSEIKKVVSQVLGEQHSLTPSKTSKNGKYTSLNLIIEVRDESHRDEIYTKLNNIEQLKMVM